MNATAVDLFEICCKPEDVTPKPKTVHFVPLWGVAHRNKGKKEKTFSQILRFYYYSNTQALTT